MSEQQTGTSSTTTARVRAPRTRVQLVALVVGVVFLVVGVLGFVPGITTNYSALGGAGNGSMAMLVGLFQVSVLHNVVHLAFGVVGVLCARTARAARNYLVWGGVVYLVIWLYGLIVAMNSPANFVPLNTADNWLHFVLGVVMILLGVLVGRRAVARTAKPAARV